MRKQLALALGAAAASVTLVGGVAFAAIQPADVPSSAAVAPALGVTAVDEDGKPPLAKLDELLSKLVSEGKLTAEQKATILTRLHEAAGQPRKAQPALTAKSVLAHVAKSAAAYIGITERALATELQGKSLAEVALTHGKTRDGLIGAIAVDANKALDEALAKGAITPDQAAAAKAEVAKRVPALVDAKHEAKRAPQRERLPDAHAFVSGYLKVAREHIGIDERALQERLRAGQSLAEIAVANGKTRDGLIAAVTAAANERIDELKAKGRLTEQAAAKAKAQAAGLAAKVVDAKRGVRSR